jgi:hypothetical protein
MPADLIPAEQGALQLRDDMSVQRQPTPMEMIAAIARDPSIPIDRISALVGLQERMEEREAERLFNAAFRAASMEMPKIEKRGLIDMGGKGSMKFAKYEDVDKVVRAVEIKHGFTRSFLSEPCPGGILITCKLSHAAGHSERSTRQMPSDTGAGRNAMQAIGSASSYAKRYLTLDVWNIVTGGADDDGNSADPITQEQMHDLDQWLKYLALEPGRLAKVWAWIGPPAVSVATVQRGQFDKLAKYLKGLIHAMEGGKK